MVASGPTVGLVGAVAVALGFAAGHWAAKRRRATKGVFVLAVRLKTETVEQRDEIIRLFTPLAQYVQEHESETLSYQLAIADTDPTLIQIYERYASKAALTELHHSSEAYKTFKAAIAELPFPVEKSGQSFFEEAIGYM